MARRAPTIINVTRITAFPRINARKPWYQNSENINKSIKMSGVGFQRVRRKERKHKTTKAISNTVIQTARARVKSLINANGRKKAMEYKG